MASDHEGGYTIVLHPLEHEVPAVIRMRVALKRLLRDHQLRCVQVVPALPAEFDQPEKFKGSTAASPK